MNHTVLGIRKIVAIILAITMVVLFVAGCARPEEAPAALFEETPIDGEAQQPLTEESISTVEADIEEINDLNDELDLSDLDSLDEDLAELEEI